MIAQKIRRAILQAAMQGKLTEQLDEDGIDENSLKYMLSEKVDKTNSNSKKNDVNQQETLDDENSYEIPKNWCWIELRVISEIRNGFTPLRSNATFWAQKDIPWFTVSDIRQQGHIIKSTQEYISKSSVVNDCRIVPKNSVLLCCTASIGVYAFTEISLVTNQQFNGITIRKSFENVINPYFIYFWVQTIEDQLIKLAGKTTFPFLSTKKLGSFQAPIPPHKEQLRIIEKLSIVLPQIDKLEEDEIKNESLQQQFPNNMKKAVLKHAFQGKLVCQLPEEGDASVIVTEINNLRKQLIYDGKIKREPTSQAIVEDEIPFDIPNSWEWVRLSQLIELSDAEKNTGINLPILDARFLRGKCEAQIINTGKFVEKNTKLILVDGENSGEVFEAPQDGYLGSTFKKLIVVDDRIWPYLSYFLKMNQDFFRNNKTGSAIPHLNKQLFKEMLIPVPPIEEQKRIVSKLDQILVALNSVSI